MEHQFISSRFIETIKDNHSDIQEMQVNNVICLMIDYLDSKGLIDMNDFMDFLDSQLLADKMKQENTIQEDEDWKFK